MNNNWELEEEAKKKKRKNTSTLQLVGARNIKKKKEIRSKKALKKARVLSFEFGVVR